MSNLKTPSPFLLKKNKILRYAKVFSTLKKTQDRRASMTQTGVSQPLTGEVKNEIAKLRAGGSMSPTPNNTKPIMTV